MAPPEALETLHPKAGQNTDDFCFQFWEHVINRAENSDETFKSSNLPLTRIKKIIKLDPDIKMVPNEVLHLLSKACEIFIAELSSRTYLHATSRGRRTLYKTDVTAAAKQSDQYDFLIDILPQEEDHNNTDKAISKKRKAAETRALNPKPKKKPKATKKKATTDEDEDQLESEANQQQPADPIDVDASQRHLIAQWRNEVLTGQTSLVAGLESRSQYQDQDQEDELSEYLQV